MRTAGLQTILLQWKRLFFSWEKVIEKKALILGSAVMLASKAVTQIKSDQDQVPIGAPVRLKFIPIFKVSLLNAEGNY